MNKLVDGINKLKVSWWIFLVHCVGAECFHGVDQHGDVIPGFITQSLLVKTFS